MLTAAKKAAEKKWGKAWALISAEQQQAEIESQLLWALADAAPLISGDEFKAIFLDAMKGIRSA